MDYGIGRVGEEITVGESTAGRLSGKCYTFGILEIFMSVPDVPRRVKVGDGHYPAESSNIVPDPFDSSTNIR